MSKLCQLIVGLWLYAALQAFGASMATLHLPDGTTVTGEIITMTPQGIVLKKADETYTDHIPWAKLSQEDLRFLRQFPKAVEYVDPFIELTQQEKIQRTEVDIKEVPKLERQPGRSLIGGIFGSGVGLFMVVILYAGNLYAAYEISVFRARSPGLVCGLAAVLPVLGPVIFLSMPRQVIHLDDSSHPEGPGLADEGVAAAIAAEQAPAAASHSHLAAARPATQALPPTKSFPRGQFTFNRRFFETQMPGFFAVSRAGAEKDLVLTIKAARGNYIAQRIARITANELYLQVPKGNVFEEIVVPFAEVQEVQIKHKNA